MLVAVCRVPRQRNRRKRTFHGGQSPFLSQLKTSLWLDSALPDAHTTDTQVTQLDFAPSQRTVSIFHSSHQYKHSISLFANVTSATELAAISMGSDCSAQTAILSSSPDNIFFTREERKGEKRTIHVFMSPGSHCTYDMAID